MQELAIRAVPVQVRCEFDDYQVVVYETEAGELTAVGSLLCTEGECVLHGNFAQHKKYGKQFQVTYCEEVLPTTPEGMKRYLVGSGIAEIGSAIADRIVDTFGAETFQAMRDPVRLRHLKNARSYRNMYSFWQTTGSQAEKQKKFIRNFPGYQMHFRYYGAVHICSACVKGSPLP